MSNKLIHSLMLLSFHVHGQTGILLTNKTLRDSVFAKGDIIKIPELAYSFSHPMNKNVYDSLAPVIAFLNKYPQMKIEIGAHTDSRGNNQSNTKLTDFRAGHVWDYLFRSNGIDTTRLTFKGYGESLLIISDEEIAKAKTKEEKERLHKINRRTELKVLDTH